MREPPNLAEEAIRRAVEANYGIPVARIRFLPLGADAYSAAFEVDAEGGLRFFLKCRRDEGFSTRSLSVPRSLNDAGLPNILAPLPTAARALWTAVDGFTLSLFPFVEGRRAAEVGLVEAQWLELGKTVREIHAVRLSGPTLESVPREDFVPSRRAFLNVVPTLLERDDEHDELRDELADAWRSRHAVIGALMKRCDELARHLRAAPPPFVLCHADLHNWNVLVEPGGGIWIVDWDETILAPKERDLMFVVGGIGRGLVRTEETGTFLRGYGEPTVGQLPLTYYRYAWALQDMAAYAEQVLLLKDWSESARREAVEGFLELFEPGQIVDIALASSLQNDRAPGPRRAGSTA